MIPRLEDPTYQEFRLAHLLNPTPALLSPKVTAAWPAFGLWVASPSEVAYQFLIETYGELSVSVLDCSTGLSDQRRLGPLLLEWKKGGGTNLYAKDIHLPRAVKERGRSVEDEVYRTPFLWEDDWMHQWSDFETDDDFRFVYIGGGDTFTLLHRDVFSSYSVSTNVYGTKKWTLFPPGCTSPLSPILKAAEHQGISVDVRTWTSEMHDAFRDLGMFEIEQRAGESIFIPSGWYHQVENLTHPTISLNHNWANSHNLAQLYACLSEEVNAAYISISDVEDLLRKLKPSGIWEYEFQECLDDLTTQHAGWNWMSFWKMVLHALNQAALPTPESESFRPPVGFLVGIIQPLLTDFWNRNEKEHLWCRGLADILIDIQKNLDCIQIGSK